MLPPVRFLGEFRFTYETYHMRILFFERYVRSTLTYSILAYASPRAMIEVLAAMFVAPRVMLVHVTAGVQYQSST